MYKYTQVGAQKTDHTQNQIHKCERIKRPLEKKNLFKTTRHIATYPNSTLIYGTKIKPVRNPLKTNTFLESQHSGQHAYIHYTHTNGRGQCSAVVGQINQ